MSRISLDCATTRRAMVEQGMSKLQAATTMAAETLTAIIQDKAVAPSVRVKASQVQLLYSTRWLHMLEIIERLDQLEAKSAGKGDVIDAGEYANFRYDAVEGFGTEETGND